MWKGNIYVKSIEEFCNTFINETYESYDEFPNPKNEYDIDIIECEINQKCTDEVIDIILKTLLSKPDIKEAYREDNKLIIVLDEEYEEYLKQQNPEYFGDWDEF